MKKIYALFFIGLMWVLFSYMAIILAFASVHSDPGRQMPQWPWISLISSAVFIIALLIVAFVKGNRERDE